MFLAFPLNSKPDWRNPPWMTILLIVINCIIFFGPQRTDEKRSELAAQAYFNSRLPAIELPRYATFLQERNHKKDREVADLVLQSLQHRHIGQVWMMMERDQPFMEKLRAGQIIQPQEFEYAEWHTDRARIDGIRGVHFTERWASNPAHVDPITMLTSVFLHGSLEHLLGNMLFLFAFGYTVEMTLGRARYLVFYLLAGVGGFAGDLAARWGDFSIGLGASGAISGLMALYALLYGTRKIKFFYQFLFYFDYIRAPAIILLPFWIVDQVYLQLTQSGSGVAYMAHVGGLVTGAILGGLYRWANRKKEIQLPPEKAPDPFQEGLQEADGLVRRMKLVEARNVYETLVGMRADDPFVVGRFFNLARLNAADEVFHKAAAAVFALRGGDRPTAALVTRALPLYLQLAQPKPRLNADQIARLALRMANENQAALAEKLAGALVKSAPAHGELPAVVFGLARMYQRKGDLPRATQWHTFLLTQFPASAESRLAL